MLHRLPRFGAWLVALVALSAIGTGPARASITDLSGWSLMQDPPNALFTASATPTQATLLAGNGPVPGGTDIGYASVDGATPATSTAGYAFDPSSSFAIAVDFEFTFSNTPTGTLALGFGIGEDRDGANSAGAVLLTSGGSPLAYGAAARVNDVNQAPQLLGLAASLSGSLFASYDAPTGDITLGAANTQDANAPTASATYSGFQNQWSDGLLLASFFLRSDASLGQPWQSGNAQAVFSNFRVLSGTPVSVPEPTSLALLAAGGLLVLFRLRRACGT